MALRDGVYGAEAIGVPGKALVVSCLCTHVAAHSATYRNPTLQVLYLSFLQST
jgi:hypothetical protein